MGPDTPNLPGADLTHSAWDVLSGDARLSGDVLLFDETGDHPTLVCADVMAKGGCNVRHVSPDRATAYELGPTNSVVILRDLANQGVTFACFLDIENVTRKGNRKEVTLKHVLTQQKTTRVVDHIVIEYGVAPMETLYLELKHKSSNHTDSWIKAR